MEPLSLLKKFTMKENIVMQNICYGIQAGFVISMDCANFRSAVNPRQNYSLKGFYSIGIGVDRFINLNRFITNSSAIQTRFRIK